MSSYQYFGLHEKQDLVTKYYLECAELFNITPLLDTKLNSKRYVAVYRCANRDFPILTKHPNPQPIYTGYVYGVDKYNTHSLYGAPLAPSPEISDDIFVEKIIKGVEDFGADGFVQTCSLD